MKALTDRTIDLIYTLGSAAMTICKQTNTTRGVTKQARMEERRAVAALFVALTGYKPTEDEISRAIAG